MTAFGFIFPGQGSQFTGMGLSFYEAFPTAREVFEEVDEALSENLSELIFRGEVAELTLTRNTQPALMAVSLAVTEVIKKDMKLDFFGKTALVAGHSLGEYSALTAAGSFSLSEAARLLRIRGDAMQNAVSPQTGAMAALLGTDLAATEALCLKAATESGKIVTPANDNGGGQVVISGHKEAVEAAIRLGKEEGVFKKAVLLPVSAPFHCPLMAKAAETMQEALTATPPKAPKIPLIANVTAAKTADPAVIQDLLVKQVTGVVRFRESLQTMHREGVTCFIEAGAGKVLTGLVKRTLSDAATLTLNEPADLDALAKIF